MRIATASIVPSPTHGIDLLVLDSRPNNLATGFGRMRVTGVLAALGLITIVMPVSATATVATTMTLATMHLITGLVWSSWSGVPPDKGLLSAARSARAIIKR